VKLSYWEAGSGKPLVFIPGWSANGAEYINKQAVASEITESIVRNTGTDPKYIYVIFEDVAPSDWAGEGKLFGG